MEEPNIIEITTVFNAVGVGFVFQPMWKSLLIYIFFLSIEINFVAKTENNKWFNYQHILR